MIANGDIYDSTTALRALSVTGADMLMIGEAPSVIRGYSGNVYVLCWERMYLRADDRRALRHSRPSVEEAAAAKGERTAYSKPASTTPGTWKGIRTRVTTKKRLRSSRLLMTFTASLLIKRDLG